VQSRQRLPRWCRRHWLRPHPPIRLAHSRARHHSVVDANSSDTAGSQADGTQPDCTDTAGGSQAGDDDFGISLHYGSDSLTFNGPDSFSFNYDGQ